MGDFTSPDAASACKECVIAKACEPMAGCLADPSCVAIATCINNAPNQDTSEACQALSDGGGFNAAANQITSVCENECEVYSDWTCVGHVSAPRAKSASSAVTVRLLDLNSKAPVPNVTVKLCNPTDGDCSKPTDTQPTDTNGSATVTAKAFGGVGGSISSGYIDLASDAGSIYPQLFYWSFNISEPVATFGGILVQTPSDISTEVVKFVGDAGLDPARGIVIVTAYDCRNSYGKDVVVTLSSADSATKLFYFVKGAPDTTATSTDESGIAVFLNVPTNVPSSLTVTPNGLGRPSSEIGFIVRPSTISYVYAPPTPQ